MVEQTEFSAEVRDVFSGDDLILFIDLGMDGVFLKRRFRLHGVDTPNAVGQGHDTEAGRLRSLVFGMTKRVPLRIRIVNRMPHVLTGILYIVRPEGELNVNEMLIAKGYKFNRNKEIA